MWLIVGLGNPGRKYNHTRHNVGFALIDKIANSESTEFQRTDRYQIGGCLINGNDVLLLKPLTYMNRSGVVVREMVNKYSITLSHLLVCHDDIDLDIGLMKIKRQGSSGGHRGVESIINELSSHEFIRLKIGIGRDQSVPVDEYVLSRFSKAENDIINKVLINAESAIREIVLNGVDIAMNKYNRKNVVL